MKIKDIPRKHKHNPTGILIASVTYLELKLPRS